MRQNQDGSASESEDAISERINSFLRPFERERRWSYNNRLSMAVYRNLFASVIDTLAAFVQSKPVVRDAGGTPHLVDLWGVDGDMDLRGSSMDEFMREGLRGALTYGLVHCIVDLPNVAPGTIRSLRDEQAMGLRPYARWISPLLIPRWRHDPFGRLLKVEILEPDTREYEGDEWGAVAREPLSRIWYAPSAVSIDGGTEVIGRGRWELRQGGPRGHIIDEGEYDHDAIPLETLYCRRAPGEPMRGLTPGDDIARIGERIFNLDSEIQVLERKQYPVLVVPGGEKLGKVDLGTSDAFSPPADGQMPAWINPSPESIKVLKESVVDHMLQIRARAGLSRGVSEQSIAARSGDALLIETSERTSVVMALAQEAHDFERRLAHRIAAVGGATFTGSVTYPETYDMDTLADQIDRATAFAAVPEMPAAAKRKNAEVLWRARFKSLAEAELTELESAIEAEMAPVPDATAAPTPGAADVSGDAAGGAAVPSVDEDGVKFFQYEIEGGLVTINEVRRSKGLGPIPDGHLTLPAFRGKHSALFAASTVTQASGSAEKIVGLDTGEAHA